ncbi:xanthine dehydrogenase family protein molybdopterin-binding subunit [Microbulbifer halophilus]|uniref:Xanthine dehydrogenase family protein molybdopterin-binding subunit n=1 Tax=Microbulbifer halophilus TaxID=453963 RepID=A0ABW5EBW3_9GAMM|nr:molybdopterin cofactor-binding domain-containing protein [Microbulbifer halophilus]MCW8126527.1 molybdopterin-dependent oxidoreductase [Microbulbifer halophilus]
MKGFRPDRRNFIKLCTVAGIAVFAAPSLWQLGRAGQADKGAKPLHWRGDGADPAFRTDGVAKVTGEKIFGRDFRSADMPGWLKQQHYAFILRCNRVERQFAGVDWSQLPEGAEPYERITAQTLADNKFALPPFYGEAMLLAEGETPHYYGHAVAILLFDSFEKYATTKQALQFNESVIRYGEETPPYRRDPYASWRIIRVEGEGGPTGEDLYSPLQDGIFFPQYRDRKAEWPSHADQAGSVSERGIYYAQEIRHRMEREAAAGNWHLVEGDYNTQIVEPMMMEPEASNGWFDSDSKTLHLVLTSQSPQDFREMAAQMIAESGFAGRVENLVVHSGFVGGGFGAKDHSIFPYYGAVAALFARAPLRLANNRFEQFQAGLKRHPFRMHNTLAVDKKTGKFQALLAEMQVDGGGRQNFSPSVSMVGASAIQSIYYLPRNDIISIAHQSMNVDAGSMRGYGTLQTMNAMEMMVNRAAGELDLDPIELRLRNAFETGWRNTQGAVPRVGVRYREMLERARRHPIWRERAERKRIFEEENPDYFFGTGYAIATKDYGTGAAAPSSAVQFDPEGRLSLAIGFMEMGTGTQTSQAMLLEDILGVPAADCHVAEIEAWEALQQFQTESPYTMSQEHQDRMAADPLWTPVVAMASSASMSAYFQSHVTLQAARILFRQGLVPAARKLWQLERVDLSELQWRNGALEMAGQPSLPLARLAAEAHRSGLVTGVMAHGFNRWDWAEADFNLNGERQTWVIDGLALRRGGGAERPVADEYRVLKRSAVRYPPTDLNNAMVTYYAPCAALVEVVVHKGTGAVEIHDLQNYLECGRPIVRQLVEGQIEGGVAMGIGHALYEILPPLAGGAGNGTWNLNRYQVALAKDVCVWKQRHEILAPESDQDPHKGIAEVVMVPIVAALAEAIFRATGKRFNDTPITPEVLRRALNPQVL